MKLTCVDGHYVGRLANTVRRGEVVDAGLLDDMQGDPVTNGMLIGTCTCGKAWIGRGCNPHTETGWMFPDIDHPGNYVPVARPQVTRHGPVEFLGPSEGVPLLRGTPHLG